MENISKSRGIGCVVMASGEGKRFGGGKLFAPFRGMPLSEYALKLAGCGAFSKAVAVTRNPDFEALCKKNGVDCILHNLPDRSDTVRIGVRAVADTGGCCFMPADQPLLSEESVRALAADFSEHPDCICRLASSEGAGAPVIFPRSMYAELENLPKGFGGGYLIKKYMKKSSGRVREIPVRNGYELYDADTRDDLERLLNISTRVR